GGQRPPARPRALARAGADAADRGAEGAVRPGRAGAGARRHRRPVPARHPRAAGREGPGPLRRHRAVPGDRSGHHPHEAPGRPGDDPRRAAGTRPGEIGIAMGRESESLTVVVDTVIRTYSPIAYIMA